MLKKILLKVIGRERMLHWALNRTEQGIIKFLDKNSYLYTTGWLESYTTGKITDQSGNPIPWLSYSMTDLLESRLPDGLNIFEYGSGYSTLYFSNKAKKVVSVEYDRVWYDLLKPSLKENTELLFAEKDAEGYVSAIASSGGQYDVVLIDGRRRVECFHFATDYLNENGVIIFDDFERAHYRVILPFLTKNNFRFLEFTGLAPMIRNKKSTALIYRADNILNI